MKVYALKKINEYAKNNNFTLDYEGLLRISFNNINKILAYIDKNKKNVENVINFMIWELDNPNWKDKFQHLDGIGEFDIRDYLILKILYAHSNWVSNLIFTRFDFNDSPKSLKLFNNVSEWKAYIENIGESMGQNEDLVISNLKFILEKTQEYEYRCNLIKQVMEYSQRVDFDPKYLNEYFNDKELEPHIPEILSLLVEGYDIEEVSRLFKIWERRVDPCVDEEYQKVITYLKESKLFTPFKDNASLIEIFNKNCTMDYEDIILLLKEIEEKEDRELFEKCLKNHGTLSNSSMREYTRKILYAKVENNDYRDSLMYLLTEKVIASDTFYESENNILSVCAALNLSLLSDESSMEMARFIAHIRYAGIITDIEITKDNLFTRQVLYNDFPKFIIDSPLSANQIEHYADWLTKLCRLPADICQKVMNIINIPLIKNMDIDHQKQIKELVLDPENFGSLEYIYTKYKDKEEEYNKYHSIKEQTPIDITKSESNYNPEVKLITVLELLESDNDIDKVLEGFNDDDEITPKTLIRSITDKNNIN